LLGKPLVARERELSDLVASVTQGAGAVLLGPGGVGKTALAGAVAEQTATAGDRVERVVATEASRSIPFGALATLIPHDIDSLHPAAVLGAIGERHGEGGARPPLIVVDDAHLLDDQSAATLLGLVTSGGGRVVATVRSGAEAPDAVHALWKDGWVARHDIGPFDHTATRAFLAAMLGGEVAAGSASLLWQHTRGNALYLNELVRDATASHQLVDEHGVWIWRGGVTVPPRLADLLDRRFDGLTADGLDALGALVLGEPLPLAVLDEIATMDGIVELEARQVVEADEHEGLVWFRFAHPMLAAAAARHLAPTRRRRIADALVAAPSTGTDVVRRAMWQLDSSSTPDVELLLASARAVFLTQPALAQRLAERALPHDTGPSSALLLADAHAEQGRVEDARHAQTLAKAAVRTDDDLMRVRLNQVSLTAFSDRRPDIALDLLAEARAELPPSCHPEIDSMAVQLTVFSARPADALVLAERLLDQDPPWACAMRASSARMIALSLVDRSVEAMALGERLLVEVATGPATPYMHGIAHVADLVARFVYWVDQASPATDPSGRWPVPPVSGHTPRQSESVFFPLFDGGRRLLEGHAAAAVAPLREAVAQQRIGEGLLRSEAVALLVVALAATGEIDEARALVADSPPDRVALYSGLRPWAAAAVEAAAGRPAAIDLAFEAYDEARLAGSPISAVAYLAVAARSGAAARAASELERMAHRFESPICEARAMSITARASGAGDQLLEAAERHAALGLKGEASGLAELAAAAMGRSADASRAAALLDDLRRGLRRGDSSVDARGRLTRRELEVASLAATGMADRDIAEVLFVSVRTVESHLASAYRKLGISSRRELTDAL